MLTLPPQMSNKTRHGIVQSLEISKSFFNQNANGCITTNPGQTLTIFEFAPLCALAWDRAVTPVNVKSRFRFTGI